MCTDFITNNYSARKAVLTAEQQRRRQMEDAEAEGSAAVASARSITKDSEIENKLGSNLHQRRSRETEDGSLNHSGAAQWTGDPSGHSQSSGGGGATDRNGAVGKSNVVDASRATLGSSTRSSRIVPMGVHTPAQGDVGNATTPNIVRRRSGVRAGIVNRAF